MRTWELAVPVESGDAPLFQRIAAVVARDIDRARLKPGERLPSSRELAAQLAVNRNTVIAAYEELRRQGWIESVSTRGMFVAAALPSRATGAAVPRESRFDLPPALPTRRPAPRTPNSRLLLGGVPDLRLIPARELARAYARALKGARGRRAIDYGDPQGAERLRAALGELLARTRGITASPDAICVVRGSQHGLFLAAHALLRRGDVVAVETPGYPPGWEALRLAGAELAPIPVDADGLDVAALAALCATGRVRAVLVTPHHQYPTTVAMSAARRRQLLALARQYRLLVLEDDYDFEFHYEGPPILPLAAEDPAGVVYVATLSKSLAPGLRLGYVVAPPPVIDRLVAYRSWVDQQGDHVVEHAVAQLLEEGELQRHTRRVRRVYRARRDALLAALAAHLPGVEAAAPSGGMALWARAPGEDTTAWRARAAQVEVAFQDGGALTFAGGPNDRLRLGFAACTEEELDDAARRLARVRRG